MWIYKRALEQREKKLLWTWIYANLHTPANPTFYENIRDTMWWRKKWTSTVIHSPIDFLYVRKFGKPYIWGIWDNHTHMLCVGRTQQKMKFILRITMHFGPELNNIHMVNNNTPHKKSARKSEKIWNSQIIYDLMAEQWPVAIHFFGAYFDNSPFENGHILLSSLLVRLIPSKICSVAVVIGIVVVVVSVIDVVSGVLVVV